MENRFVLHRSEPFRVTQLRPGPPAAGYYPDKWMTFQVHVHPGSLGTAMNPLTNTMVSGYTNSSVDMWVARHGEPSVQTHHFTAMVLRRDAGAAPLNADGRDQKYGKVWFTPFQTHKDPAQFTATGHTWIDELIVSTSKLTDP